MNIKSISNQNNVLNNKTFETQRIVSNNFIFKDISVKTLVPIKPSTFQAYSNISFKALMQEHLGQGARYLRDGKTIFTITAPYAENVMVSIFSDEINNKDDVEVQRKFLDKKDDKFEAIINNTRPGDKYLYTVTKKDGSVTNLYDPRADYLPCDIDDYSDKANDEVIAVINLSSKPQEHFKLETTSPKKLKEVINSNDKIYKGNGEYNNKKWNIPVDSVDLVAPPYGIAVFVPAK